MELSLKDATIWAMVRLWSGVSHRFTSSQMELPPRSPGPGRYRVDDGRWFKEDRCVSGGHTGRSTHLRLDEADLEVTAHSELLA